LTCDIYYSNKRLQYESTECGVYCLWFLDKRLNGIEFKKFCNDICLPNQLVRLVNFDNIRTD